jgi:hypothetical protein
MTIVKHNRKKCSKGKIFSAAPGGPAGKVREGPDLKGGGAGGFESKLISVITQSRAELC